MEFFVFVASALAAWALVVGFRAERRATRLEGIVDELLNELRFVRRSPTSSPKAGPAAAAVAESSPVAPGAAGSEEAVGAGHVPPPLPVRPAAMARPAPIEPPPTPTAQGPVLAERPQSLAALAVPLSAVTPLPQAPPPLPPHEVPPSPPAGDPWAPIKDWLLGGNTIVKVGVGILFVGLAFLAKYASQHVHVPIEFRLAGIGAVAIVLLVIGWRLRLRRPGYAQVMQGGAVAVLYLTLFVAFKVYGVIAVGPVFALMIAVAGLAAALAVLQDAKSLAVVGALGGFAAPILVSTGSGNYVALFTYYLVLDLGIAAVAWHKAWRSLNLIGFFATLARQGFGAHVVPDRHELGFAQVPE